MQISLSYGVRNWEAEADNSNSDAAAGIRFLPVSAQRS